MSAISAATEITNSGWSASRAISDLRLPGQVGPRVLARGRLVERADGGPGLLVQLGRDVHLDGHDEVAGALRRGEAAALDAEPAARRRALRDLDPHGAAVERGHLDRGAE